MARCEKMLSLGMINICYSTCLFKIIMPEYLNSRLKKEPSETCLYLHDNFKDGAEMALLIIR